MLQLAWGIRRHTQQALDGEVDAEDAAPAIGAELIGPGSRGRGGGTIKRAGNT